MDANVRMWGQELTNSKICYKNIPVHAFLCTNSRSTGGKMTEKPKRGFGRLDPKVRSKIAARGGSMVPDERRSFAINRALAAEAGRKGGSSVDGEKRSFSTNRILAAEAGRKGGQASQRKRRGHD